MLAMLARPLVLVMPTLSLLNLRLHSHRLLQCLLSLLLNQQQRIQRNLGHNISHRVNLHHLGLFQLLRIIFLQQAIHAPFAKQIRLLLLGRSLGPRVSAVVHPSDSLFPLRSAIRFSQACELFDLALFFAFAADLLDLLALGEGGLFGFPDFALVAEETCVPGFFEVEITATHGDGLGLEQRALDSGWKRGLCVVLRLMIERIFELRNEAVTWPGVVGGKGNKDS